MLNIHYIRSHPEKVKENLAKRQDSTILKNLKHVLELDKTYLLQLQAVEDLRKKRNTITKEIDKAKHDGKDIHLLVKKAKDIPKHIKELEEKTKLQKIEVLKLLYRIPNLLDDSVPFGKDESENVEIKLHGKKPTFSFPLKNHKDIALGIEGADFESAVDIAGTGFFALKNELALLDIALQRFAIDLLLKKKFSLVQPPLFMNRSAYEGVTDLNDFETVMYKIQDEDLYLIATSEHPLVAMHRKTNCNESQLPLKLAGVSPCFRKEVGKRGIDERGLFRVHQFNKVEQTIICKPEDSSKFHEELLKNSEELMQKLGIHYQIVNVCTGDIGIVAAKKYDINAYSPREETFIEVMSCSNATDYQANRSSIKYIDSKNEKHAVHILNNTMVATTRMLRIILETFQRKDGSIEIPKVLRPYMNGIKEIKVKK